jgi:hypothetical protein
MKLSIMANKETPQPTQKKPSVVIASNLKRERVLIDVNGNEINNFKTKEIINKIENQ